MRRCSVITTGRLEADHIAALEGLQGEVTVDRRCADLAELMAAAESMRADAALIIGGTSSLTGTLLDRLRDAGLRVVVISDVAEERRRLAALGAATLRDEAGVEQLAGTLLGSPGAAPPPPPRAQPGSGRASAGAAAGKPAPGFEEILAAQDLAQDLAQGLVEGQEEVPEPSPAGGITVVWGSHGSPGRTTVAVNMAAELAAAGHRVLLIDADTTAAGVVTHLGLLEESAGLAQACRQADLGKLDALRLRRSGTTAEVAGHRLHLLTGLPRPSRWPELRSRSLREVLRLARAEYTCVVVDVSASAEQDEELTYDTAAPQRHAATVTALQEADRLLALGACDAMGFPRLVKAVEDLREQVPEAPAAEVVITKVRRSAVGRSPQDQLRSTWERFAPGAAAAPSFLPWDAQACDAALLKGQSLAEAAPESELRRSIAALAGVDLQTRRRRRPALRRRESALG